MVHKNSIAVLTCKCCCFGLVLTNNYVEFWHNKQATGSQAPKTATKALTKEKVKTNFSHYTIPLGECTYFLPANTAIQ